MEAILSGHDALYIAKFQPKGRPKKRRCPVCKKIGCTILAQGRKLMRDMKKGLI
jgi:hypothetical protein